MTPFSWSYSYLFRLPRGISTTTSIRSVMAPILVGPGRATNPARSGRGRGPRRRRPRHRTPHHARRAGKLGAVDARGWIMLLGWLVGWWLLWRVPWLGGRDDRTAPPEPSDGEGSPAA